MSESVKKWLLWGSSIILFFSIVGVIIVNTSSISYTTVVEAIIQMIIGPLLVMSLLNLIFLIANKYQNRNGFRKAVKISTYLFLAFVISIFILIIIKWLFYYTVYGLTVVVVIGSFILMPFTLIHIFLFNEIKSTRGIVLILLYILISLVLKRLSGWSSEVLVRTSFIMMGCGMYLFGLRCLFKIEKNRFLKIVSILACVFINLGCFEMIGLSATYADITLIIFSISVFLITLIILLSLPVSGYIQWNSLHKKLYRKILVPWVFLMLLVTARFIFPELNMFLFKEKDEQYQEFYMWDYEIINKNGLKPE
jgi:hypothetical protein